MAVPPRLSSPHPAARGSPVEGFAAANSHTGPGTLLLDLGGLTGGVPIRGIWLDSGRRHSLLWDKRALCGALSLPRGGGRVLLKVPRLLSLRGNRKQCSSERRPLIWSEAVTALMSREDTLPSTQASARRHHPLLDSASSVPWLPHAALASGLRVTAGRLCYLWPQKPRMACGAPKVRQPSPTTTA